MTKRDLFNEVLTGLREIVAFESGKNALLTRRVRPIAPPVTRVESMRGEYELRGATRGAVIKESGKRRITIRIDCDILTAFRQRAARTGCGYQTLINQALRDYLATSDFEAKSSK